MSRAISNRAEDRAFGPRDQQLEPPWERPRRSGFWRVVGWFLFAIFLHGWIDPNGPDAFGWSLQLLIFGWAGKSIYRGVQEGRIPVRWLVRLAIEIRWGVAIFFARHAPLRLVESAERRRHRRERLEPQPYVSTASDARYEIERRGGGAYLGVYEDGDWATAEPESGTMIIGPPRRGKTTAVIILALRAPCSAPRPSPR